MDRESLAHQLGQLEDAIRSIGEELALFLVYERPDRVEERPALARTFYAERCMSEAALNEMIVALRSVEAYVELFANELDFITALTDGRIERLRRRVRVIYNGIGWGITEGGFEPGRKALLPALADSFGLYCANSDAYTSALALHRFHSIHLLRALGVLAPPVWHFRRHGGWAAGRPPAGERVIVKSTYEAWSVGVTEDSVFVVDGRVDDRVAAIAESIGQSVTVQRFVAGREVCVPIVSCPGPELAPPVEQVLAKAPRDAEAFFTIGDNLDASAVSYVPYSCDEPTWQQMRETSFATFDHLQMRGIGRMDFRVDEDGVPWLTDVAISPSWDHESSIFASLSQLGLSYEAFLRVLVASAISVQAPWSAA